MDILPPRQGAWMQTFSGKKFWPVDPRPEDVDIADIAHALSMQPRYAGHCVRFYSVAEHSVLVSENCKEVRAQRAALLHDASEAYIVDIPRPLKPYLSNYKELETRLCECIADKFGVAYPWPEEVIAVDNAILSDERQQIMRPMDVSDEEWGNSTPKLGTFLHCMEPQVAKLLFMRRFHELFT